MLYTQSGVDTPFDRAHDFLSLSGIAQLAPDNTSGIIAQAALAQACQDSLFTEPFDHLYRELYGGIDTMHITVEISTAMPESTRKMFQDMLWAAGMESQSVPKKTATAFIRVMDRSSVTPSVLAEMEHGFCFNEGMVNLLSLAAKRLITRHMGSRSQGNDRVHRCVLVGTLYQDPQSSSVFADITNEGFPCGVVTIETHNRAQTSNFLIMLIKMLVRKQRQQEQQKICHKKVGALVLPWEAVIAYLEKGEMELVEECKEYALLVVQCSAYADVAQLRVMGLQQVYIQALMMAEAAMQVVFVIDAETMERHIAMEAHVRLTRQTRNRKRPRHDFERGRNELENYGFQYQGTEYHGYHPMSSGHEMNSHHGVGGFYRGPIRDEYSNGFWDNGHSEFAWMGPAPFPPMRPPGPGW